MNRISGNNPTNSTCTGLVAAPDFGLDVLKVIESTPELMHIPIVVAAGAADPKFVRTVYELNGSCFIRKPSQMTEFLRFIETCYESWGNVVTLSPKTRNAQAGSF